ncbi:MAG: hypothetical protein ACM3PY_07455 [Omnitrophica WOR_2 bacterium]
MEQQKPIDYNHELVSLINLVKSFTPESERVIKVLRTGDEEAIRRMLVNFGNPEDYEWADITTASPWANWQIDQAVKDLMIIKPEMEALSFWAW